MPHSPEARKLWRQKPEVRAKERERDRKYYHTKRKLQIERRRELLAQFSCISCGESNPVTIDWHHLDESEKDFNISTAMTYGEDTWFNELLKCVPLCACCHRKLHNGDLCLIPEQPTSRAG